MQLNKRLLTSVIMIIVSMVFAAGATLALLASLAGPVENEFTIGNVRISLNETTGSDYSLIPGKEIEKDPCVTVKGGSEDCWLYVKLTKSGEFDEHLSFALEDGWLHLNGVDGVYYRQVVKAGGDSLFPVLQGNIITVSDMLTEEKMRNIAVAPSLTVKAYAIQCEGVEDAMIGWLRIQEEVAR